MYRKLSAAEIKAVVTKIRKKYDEFCTKFLKPRRVKVEFENRYFNAIKQNIDISNFLLAEISAIEELIKKEERKLEAAPVRQPAQPVERENFADKIIAENLRRIEKYPAISIHKDCNPEVKHLLGALNDLYEKYFPQLHHLLRNMTTHPSVRDLTSLENTLRQLAYIGQDRVSIRLTRYISLMNRFPRDYRVIEREEKDYIIESAFVLHDLCDTLELIRLHNPRRAGDNGQEFEEIYNYIQGIINDFRLKDLKRRK